MVDIRRVNRDFAVAPQLSEGDFAELASLGYGAVICNRPDGEGPGQFSSAEASAAAESAGLKFVFAPFQGPPTIEAIAAVGNLLEAPAKPVLAYCRSGTRSITAWAIAMAQSRAMPVEAIVASAAEAGYDLAALKDLLHSLGGD